MLSVEFNGTPSGKVGSAVPIIIALYSAPFYKQQISLCIYGIYFLVCVLVNYNMELLIVGDFIVLKRLFK